MIWVRLSVTLRWISALWFWWLQHQHEAKISKLQTSYLKIYRTDLREMSWSQSCSLLNTFKPFISPPLCMFDKPHVFKSSLLSLQVSPLRHGQCFPVDSLLLDRRRGLSKPTNHSPSQHGRRPLQQHLLCFWIGLLFLLLFLLSVCLLPHPWTEGGLRLCPHPLHLPGPADRPLFPDPSGPIPEHAILHLDGLHGEGHLRLPDFLTGSLRGSNPDNQQVNWGDDHAKVKQKHKRTFPLCGYCAVVQEQTRLVDSMMGN